MEEGRSVGGQDGWSARGQECRRTGGQEDLALYSIQNGSKCTKFRAYALTEMNSKSQSTISNKVARNKRDYTYHEYVYIGYGTPLNGYA